MMSVLGHIERLPIGPGFDGSPCGVPETTTPSSRDKTVNRLLDWAEDARMAGRRERAEYLLSLAWEAFDR